MKKKIFLLVKKSILDITIYFEWQPLGKFH